MGTLLTDLRLAWRALARQPGYSLTVLLALALGLGINTALFGVFHAVLLKPLSWSEPDRIVYLWATDREGKKPKGAISVPEFLDFSAHAASFSRLTAFRYYPVTFHGGGEPQRINSIWVTPGFFDVTGVAPQYGRSFTENEGLLGQNNVVILSHGFWRRAFGADPAIVGRTISLEGETHLVAGVLPAAASEHIGSDVFLPLPFLDSERTAWATRNLYVLGRLAPGASRLQAESELRALLGGLAPSHPRELAGWSHLLVPARTEITAPARQALGVLMAGTGLVLLILCANLASIVLVRAAARRKEVALRTALGARTFAVMRPWVVESLLLSLAGAALGLPLAIYTIRAIKGFAPAGMPRLSAAGLTPPVLIFSFGLAVAACLIFGLLPLLGATRVPLAAVLGEESRGASGGLTRSRLRSFLVIAEVGLATILLICAGLLVRTLSALQRVDPGFRADNVLTLRTSLPASRYAGDTARVLYLRRALASLAAVPGVVSAGSSFGLPFTNVNWRAHLEKPGQPGVRETVSYNTVSPRYLETLGVGLRQGRWFSDADTETSPQVFLVSETLARLYFQGRSPLGMVLRATVANAEVEGQVVGVVGDIRHLNLHDQPAPTLYQPQEQKPYPFLSFAVRTASDAASFTPAITRAFFDIDPELPVDRVSTLQSMLDSATSQRRLAMILLLGFALLAALLAALGIYGLLAYSVAQRGREMGIRMALGASAADLRGLIVRQGLGLTFFGLAAGLAVAPLASRTLAGLLFAVPPHDPPTYVLVVGGLLVVAFFACLIPGWRASRTDPAHALRSE